MDLTSLTLNFSQKLWEMGIVPSFDGKAWKLHAGEDAKTIYEWRKS